MGQVVWGLKHFVLPPCLDVSDVQLELPLVPYGLARIGVQRQEISAGFGDRVECVGLVCVGAASEQYLVRGCAAGI